MKGRGQRKVRKKQRKSTERSRANQEEIDGRIKGIAEGK